MPRLRRIVTPGQPLHITQRGINHWPTFFEAVDYARYRLALQRASDDAGCIVHAYVLMTNHIHLLLTPKDTMAPARMMQALGRCYVRYFNDRYRRTGTLWEGSFRSKPIASDEHLLSCYRYIELNPVSAKLVGDPRAYEWSSFHANADGRHDPIVQPHPLYLALGAGPEDRRSSYRELFTRELVPDVIAALRAGTQGRFQPAARTYEEAVSELNDRIRAERGGAAGDDVPLPWPALPTRDVALDQE